MIEREIFINALQCKDANERAAFLDEQCGKDAALRLSVEELLAENRTSKSFFLDEPAVLGGMDAATGNPIEVAKTIGRYTLREQIGEGGMGVVYVAEQTEPVQRKVALKVIKPGMDTKEVIARFEAERQALAFMEHPNIARVLDAGATESGRSYFVMELVRGIPITEYCDQAKATTRERLQLFQTVCDAVQHAHQKGIIHRDIKPSNVLVTQIGAKPVVKVIDFGLAKAISGQRLTERTLYTGFMKLMGTPAYMSPEQAGLSGLDIDTRSDIYSLGVLLYELLTGTTPLAKTEIQSQAYDELCRQIRELDAPKPSTRFSTLQDAERTTVAQLRRIDAIGLRQLLHGDLDSVVLKAIEKDRDRRYGSAQDLAADVERFLGDKPVLAVPPGTWYLARKAIRRHRLAITIAATITACLIVATVFSTWQTILVSKANDRAEAKAAAAVLSQRESQAAKRRAEREAKRAESQKKQADAARREAIASRDSARIESEQRRRLLYVSNMQSADHLWHSQSGTPYQIQKLLADWIPTSDDPKDDLRDLAWRYQWNRLHHNAEKTVPHTWAASISQRGNLLIATNAGIDEWDESAGAFSRRWSRPTEETDLPRISFSPNGRWAAIQQDATIRFVDIDAGKVIREIAGMDAAFACGGDSVVIRNRDTENSQHVDYTGLDLETGEPLRTSKIAQAYTHTLAVSPDGRSFFIARPPGYLGFYLDGTQQPWEEKNYLQVFSSAWAPNGRLVASGHFSGRIRIHAVDSLDTRIEINTERDWIEALRFTNDSRHLVVGGDKGTIDFYDLSHVYRSLDERSASKNDSTNATVAPPILVRTIKAHVSSIDSICTSHDDTIMVTRDEDGTAKLWQLDTRNRFLPRIETSKLPLAGRVGLEFDANESGVRITNVIPNEHRVVEGEINPGDRIVAISDDQRRVETSDLQGDSSAKLNIVWCSLGGPADSMVTLELESHDDAHRRTTRLQRKLNSRVPLHHDIAFTNNGIIVSSGSGTAHRAIDGSLSRLYPTMCQAVDVRTNSQLAAMSATGNIEFWNLQKNERLDLLETGSDYITARFSPDGRYFAASSGSPRLRTTPRQSELCVWETESLREVAVPLATDTDVISGVEFTPDGKKLLATDHRGRVRIWNTSTWALETTLEGIRRAFTVDVSADNEWIAQGGRGGMVIWNFRTLESRHVLPEYNVTKVLFSNDAKTLIATGQGGSVVWVDVNTGMQLATMPLESGLLTDCELAPNESMLAVLSLDGHVWLQDLESLDRIDRQAATLAALRRRALEQLASQQPEAAEQTLAYILRVQLSLPKQKRPSPQAIRSDLTRALSIQGKLPSIAMQPESQRAFEGSSVTLHVELDSPENAKIRYQWFFEGQAVEGATESSLELPNVADGQFGRYRVKCGFGAADLDMFLMSDVVTIKDASKPIVLERGLKKELFRNVPGRNIEDLELWQGFPHRPDDVTSINDFELPSNFAEEYGVRISGFVVPPKSGEYVFYLCSDDSSELYLSTDDSRGSSQRIAHSTVASAKRAWEDLKPENISKPVFLQAGQRYSVKAIFKEGTKADRFAVTWQTPDSPPPKNGDPPISGEFLQHLLE